MCLLCLVPTAIAEKLVSRQSETTLYVDWQTVVRVLSTQAVLRET